MPVAVVALPSGACGSVGSYLQVPVTVLGLTFRRLWQCWVLPSGACGNVGSYLQVPVAVLC